ncbi:MAG: hypothetical protein NTZ78_01395 [Candidatus Aureabacteria bacterium]|nr:hypothetical protein [Candidatus Auribacterota bacterium]
MSKAITVKVPSVHSRIIAISSAKDGDTIAHGNAMKTVIAKAKKAGSRDPVIIFVPKQGERYIY